MATVTLSAYSKVVGQEYLINTLQPAFESAFSTPLDCEVDPVRVPEEDRDKLLPQHMKNLRSVVECFFDRIVSSVDSVPLYSQHNCQLSILTCYIISPMREICKHIRYAVANKFGDTVAWISVGGFIFLRFFCPSMLNPPSKKVLFPLHKRQIDIHYILHNANTNGKKKICITPLSKRTILLAVKVLQNLANEADSFSEGQSFVMHYVVPSSTQNTQIIWPE